MSSAIEFHLAREKKITGCKRKVKFDKSIEFNTATHVTVEEFGAKGDGIADDTDAVQNAILRTLATGGGIVQFKKGRRYLVNRVFLAAGVTLWGYGATIVEPDSRYYFRRFLQAGFAHLGDGLPKRLEQLLVLNSTFSPIEMAQFGESFGGGADAPLSAEEVEAIRASATDILGHGNSLTLGLLHEMFTQTLHCHGGQKWHRVFETDFPSGTRQEIALFADLIHFFSDRPSLPIVVKGLCFEGARKSLGAYKANELQQKHHLNIGAARNSRERLKVFLRDLSLVNGAGDAIALGHNIDVTIRNVIADNFHRGGVSVVGSNSLIDIADFKSGGDDDGTQGLSGLNIEPEQGGSLVTDGVLRKTGDVSNRIRCENLVLGQRFEIILQDNSIFEGNKISCGSGSFDVRALHNSQIRIRNSRFIVGRMLQVHQRDTALKLQNTSLVARNNKIVFDACKFVSRFPEVPSGVAVAYHTGIALYDADRSDQGMTNAFTAFRRCNFNFDGEVPDGVELRAVSFRADHADAGNWHIFDQCEFGREFHYGIHIGGGYGHVRQLNRGTIDIWAQDTGGGNWFISDCHFQGQKGVYVGSAERTHIAAELRSCRIGAQSEQLYETPTETGTHGEDIEIVFGTLEIVA